MLQKRFPEPQASRLSRPESGAIERNFRRCIRYMEFKRMTVEQIKQNLIEKLRSNFGCEIIDATE